MSDISPISAAALLGPGLVGRSQATSPAAATGVDLGGGLGGGLGLFGGSSAIVDLSVAGQILSAASTFGANLAALRPGAEASGLGRNFGTDLSSFSAEVQNFVDNFNNLQDNLGNLAGAATTGSTGQSLGVTLAGALDQAAVASFANGSSSLTDLARIGIEFTPPPAGFVGGTLSVDQQALQEAFASDPQGSFDLLSQAAGAFSDLSTHFVAQTGDLTSSIGSLVELAATTQALSLFSSGLFGGSAGGGLQGLPGLLLLDSLTGGSNSATTNVAALSQFMLVSSLLG